MFIAKILALVYLAIGAGMIMNGKYYKKLIDDMMASPATIYLGGIMALIAGFLIVSYHNIWSQDWTVVITLFGWMGLIKGVTLLAFPKAMRAITKSMMKKWNFSVLGFCAIILGLVFGYLGMGL